jgi:hypothetical protein
LIVRILTTSITKVCGVCRNSLYLISSSQTVVQEQNQSPSTFDNEVPIVD